MQKNKKKIINHRIGHTYALMMFLLGGVLIMMLPACEHDTVAPITPDPGDTIVNPIDTTGVPCDPNIVYFEQELLPILKSNCAKSGCHDAITHEKGLILDNYQNVMASGIVRPFDLNDSELYEVITETDPDKVMPEPPNQRLTTSQIALIAQWIEQGAKNETCDDMAGVCNTEGVSYSAFVAPLLSTFCVGCHSGVSPSGNIVLNLHSGVQTVALNGRLVGAITWANGYQKMPQGSNKLSDCNIDKIKAWISDGAQNN